MESPSTSAGRRWMDARVKSRTTRRRTLASSAAGHGLLILALIAGACTSTRSSAATQSHVPDVAPVNVAHPGGKGEGPYPWKYPASGSDGPGLGPTVAGKECTPGEAQFDSPYAPPCLSQFTGYNGGPTYPGVTATQIVLAERTFPSSDNSKQVDIGAKENGYAPPEVTQAVAQTFLDYFNHVYELYGRQVVLTPFVATGNWTAEELGGGQTEACADADTLVNKLHAFGEAGLSINQVGGGTGPFSVCAAQRKFVEFNGDPYFDETTFQDLNPYVWNVIQDCERITTLSAEVSGKMLAGKPAIYAGDADLKGRLRKFATYSPAVPAYQHCVSIFADLMVHQFHQLPDDVNTSVAYELNVSKFKDSADHAIQQFKAQGITTIILSCDPISAALLTKAAAAQNYHPEWLLNGVAQTDIDQAGQTFDQGVITGHMFGLSEGSRSVYTTGPDSLAGRLYQQITGHEIPPGTDGNYASLVAIFNALQAAGPDLTPENLARGVHGLPPLGLPKYEYGKWDFGNGPSGVSGSGDHTAVSDARLIYWDGKSRSVIDNKQGTFVDAFPGQRFSVGGWPTALPPLFQNH